jgi:hypothetical protein
MATDFQYVPNSDTNKRTAGALLSIALTIAVTLVWFLAISFWDRGTTLELNHPVMVTAMGVVGLSVGGLALRHWFRPREDLPRVPDWNLKHDSPGRWALKAVGSSVLLAGISCLLVYLSLGSLAQHVPGSSTTSAARLEELQPGGSRDRCRMYAEFSRESATPLRSCVVARRGAPLLREDLQIGAAVQLEIKQNAIGRVLVSVTPSDGEPAE